MAAYQQSDPSQVSPEATPSTSLSAPSSQVTAIQIRHDNIQLNRKRAAEGQIAQVERMLKHSRLEQVAENPGDNVIILIPLVDRGRGDPRNIMGVILERNENDMYRIAVRTGILKESYSRNQFDLCPHPLHSVNDFTTDKEIGLRQAVQQGLSVVDKGLPSVTVHKVANNANQTNVKVSRLDLNVIASVTRA
ncbi:hypothetical protein LOD99_5196 [Oopsacas minuta]|uniref:Uncharacterized protein n=1 Tax=Oopsacas minuta TaxID=111878 RepID=A0AAV7JR83_9METZ|nr:hypothetical protein LOD99_5196 [Oopsacas minuta]